MAEQVKFFGNYGVGSAEGNVPAARIYLPIWYGGYAYDEGPAGYWSDVHDMYINHTPGTYTWGTDDCHDVKPYEEWVSILESYKGDHHRPNPLRTAWIGGTLYLQDESEFSNECLENWDADGYTCTIGGPDSLIDRQSHPHGVKQKTRTNSNFWGNHTTSQAQYYSNQIGIQCSPLGSRSNTGELLSCYAWASGGAGHFSTTPNIWGPYYVTAKVADYSVTVTIDSYRSWGKIGGTKLASSFTYSTVFNPGQVIVRADGTVRLSGGSYTQSYRGYFCNSSVFDPTVTYQSDSRVLKIEDSEYNRNFLLFSSIPLTRGIDDNDEDPLRHFGVARALLHAELNEQWAASWKSVNKEYGEKADASLLEAMSNQLALESNWLENFTGLDNPMNLILPLADINSAIADGDAVALASAISSAFLEWSYVLAPGYSDLKDVQENGKAILEHYTATHKPSTEIRKGQVRGAVGNRPTTEDSSVWKSSVSLGLKPEWYSPVWNALCAFGVEPSAANFWDLVPYSFVIDWFLPIGDVLAACDSMLQGRYIYTDVYYSTSYIEDREHGVTDGRKARSHLHYHFCVRFVGQGLEHIDPWSLASSCDQNFTVSQQAQGSALIIQRALPGKR